MIPLKNDAGADPQFETPRLSCLQQVLDRSNLTATPKRRGNGGVASTEAARGARRSTHSQGNIPQAQNHRGRNCAGPSANHEVLPAGALLVALLRPLFVLFSSETPLPTSSFFSQLAEPQLLQMLGPSPVGGAGAARRVISAIRLDHATLAVHVFRPRPNYE